jgi:hypothetical protein
MKPIFENIYNLDDYRRLKNEADEAFSIFIWSRTPVDIVKEFNNIRKVLRIKPEGENREGGDLQGQ